MLKPKTIAIVFMQIVLFVGLAGLCGVRAAGDPSTSATQTASTQGTWRQEFDDICARTQDAMTFSIEELVILVQRCDALLPQIEKLDDTQKKVYMGRLRMCRGLYAYVLDSKKNEKK